MDKMVARLGLLDWRSVKALGAAALVVLLVNALSVVSASQPTGKGVWSWFLAGAEDRGKTCEELALTYQDPEDMWGNPAGIWREFRLENGSLGNGTYSDPKGPLVVTLSNYGSLGFDWSSNIGVDGVVVKNGDAGAYFYVYDGLSSPSHRAVYPAQDQYYRDSEEREDIGLETPKSDAISRISFCYDPRASVKVTKSGDQLSKVGDTVGYDFLIENDGDFSLSMVSVIDTLLGDLTGKAISNGCSGLDIEQSCSFGVDRVVQAGDPDPLPNTVGVRYKTVAVASSITVTDADDHSVNLFQPAILLEKTGDSLSKVGDEVGYTITLHNKSSPDSPNLACTITDPMLGINKQVTLVAGAKNVTKATYTVRSTDPDPVVNTAHATCSPIGFPNVLKAEASWSVNLFQPAILLEKTGDSLSKVGDEVGYTITLHNKSSADSPALACTIRDPMLGINKQVTLAAGAKDVTKATYTVRSTDPDPVVNTAHATCSPVGFPNVLEAEASWSVNLFQPAIRLEKTGEGLSKVGNEVGYTITLYNESSPDSPKLECRITDAMLGIDKTVTLAAGAKDVTKATYTVRSSDADPLVNTAYAACSPIGFPNVLDTKARWSMNLFQPAIRLEKTGDSLSKVGDEVDYTITLHNDSSADSPKLECTITDPMLGIDKKVTLAAGAKDVTEATYTVRPGDPDPLRNTAHATCSPIGFPNVLEAEASWSVNLFQPAIRLEKTGDSLSKVGNEVGYTITLHNNSSPDSPKLECTITDPMLGINKQVTLAAGAKDVTKATYTVPEGASDPLVNRAHATCSPIGFPNVLEAEASWSVNLFRPAIRLEKTGDSLSKVGDEVGYTITLHNKSSADSPKLECTIRDPMLGIDKKVTLPPGASDVTKATYMVPEGASDPLLNRAYASCSPIGFPNVLEASDDHSVNLFQPAIRLEKTGESLSKVGDEVHYTITLYNESSPDSPALACTITDLMLKTDKSVTLAAGAKDVTKATYTVRPGDADPLLNTAYVFCSPVGFSGLLDAKARWSVNLFQPAISLEKTGDSLSKVGDEVDYTITLSNKSSPDSPDLACTITDEMLGIVKNVTLPPGASDVTEATYTVPEGASDPLVNTAYVSCRPVGFSGVLEASDDHPVNLFQPAIEVTKEGDAYTKIDPITGEGDTITYLFTIRNTSSMDSPPLILDSIDDVGVDWGGLGDLYAAAVAAGCDPLAPGASCAFSVDHQYQEAYPDPLLENRVTVHYHPEGFPNDISNWDDHQVTVLHPDFAVTKTCVAEPVPVGQSAAFEIVIANTGDVPLIVNTNESAIPPDLWLDPDQSVTYTVYKGPDPDAGEVYNQVIVWATLPDLYGLDNVMEKRADDVCEVEVPQIVGFTPGFWKNHWGDPDENQKNAWKYTAYDPGDTLCTYQGEIGVFECSELTGHVVEASGDNKLLSALELRGGKGEKGAAEILLRAGVAALLNASLSEELGSLHVPGFPAFPHSSRRVIDMINDALAPDAANPGETPDEHRDRMLELAAYFDRLNNSSSVEFDWNWPWVP